MFRWLKARMLHNHFWSAPIEIHEQTFSNRPPRKSALRECTICGKREWHLHPPPDMMPGYGFPLGAFEPRPYAEEHV